MENNKKVTDQLFIFAKTLQEMNTVYEDVAKSAHLSYTSLQVINIITEVENCTQKAICNATFLPKQTVNSIITNLEKNGYIKLTILETNKRLKTISFTEKGNELVSQTILKLREAEKIAMLSLSDENREIMIETFMNYSKMLQKEIN